MTLCGDRAIANGIGLEEVIRLGPNPVCPYKKGYVDRTHVEERGCEGHRGKTVYKPRREAEADPSSHPAEGTNPALRLILDLWHQDWEIIHFCC